MVVVEMVVEILHSLLVNAIPDPENCSVIHMNNYNHAFQVSKTVSNRNQIKGQLGV